MMGKDGTPVLMDFGSVAAAERLVREGGERATERWRREQGGSGVVGMVLRDTAAVNGVVWLEKMRWKGRGEKPARAIAGVIKQQRARKELPPPFLMPMMFAVVRARSPRHRCRRRRQMM